MIDHPLFNIESADDPEKRKKNIAYINIVYCEPGKKKITLTNQWEPEELLTPGQVLEAVGGVEGTYELIGRGAKHNVVDRQYLTLGSPKGSTRQPPAAPSPAASAPAAGGVFSTPMQAGGLLIPSNMDPTTAMIVSMMALQNQQNAANAAAQQQQGQFQMQQIVTMMGASQASTTQLIGTLATAFAPIFAGHASGNGGAVSGTTEAGFLKGIEIMAALREGVDQAKNSAGPADWNTITTNILKALQSVGEIAKTTAGATPPAAPVVPPGAP